jgi:hypothetical protein
MIGYVRFAGVKVSIDIGFEDGKKVRYCGVAATLSYFY